jgi:hypothetical protein
VSPFAVTLKKLMEIGDLTFADLHHWFARPRPTVRAWVERGHEPRGPSGKLARDRLRLLEHAVEYRQGLPAPRTLSQDARPAYIKQVRDGLERDGVPAGGSA